MRNNEHGHNAQSVPPDRPTFDDVTVCIEWGESFLRMVGKAFGNFAFVQSVQSIEMALKRLAHDAKIVIDPGLKATEEALKPKRQQS